MSFNQKKRHFLLMAAGCVAMLVAGFALITRTGGGSWGIYLLLLLCPAMHFLMHRKGHGNKNSQDMPQLKLPPPKTEALVSEQSRTSESKPR
jgi:hypothetical protein